MTCRGRIVDVRAGEVLARVRTIGTQVLVVVSGQAGVAPGGVPIGPGDVISPRSVAAWPDAVIRAVTDMEVMVFTPGPPER